MGLGSGAGRFFSMGDVWGVLRFGGSRVGSACGVTRLLGTTLVSGLVDESSDFTLELIEPFDMVTEPAGAPSIRSGWLAVFKVMRRAEPGGTDTFMSDKVKTAGAVEVFGRLTRMVFLPAELEP